MSTNVLPKLYSSKEDKETIDYFNDIFEAKLNLYHYCECQLNRIAFTNSIFIAAIAVLASGTSVCVLLFALPFIVSISITLLCAIPRFLLSWLPWNWKHYKDEDHRTVYGIKNLGRGAKNRDEKVKKYKKYISDLTSEKTSEKIYDEIIAQILNINDTIIRDYKGITFAVIFDVLGVAFIALYIVTINFP